jgi:hypothetical protein
MTKFDEYSPSEGGNWNAMQQIGGVWIRDGETAILRCPKCTQAINLAKHVISVLGVVTPDVECLACGWLDSVTLTAWDERYGKWWRPKFFAWRDGKASEDEAEEERQNLLKLLPKLALV